MFADSVFDPIIADFQAKSKETPEDKPVRVVRSILPEKEIHGTLDFWEDWLTYQLQSVAWQETQRYWQAIQPHLDKPNPEAIRAEKWNVVAGSQRLVYAGWKEMFLAGGNHAVRELNTLNGKVRRQQRKKAMFAAGSNLAYFADNNDIRTLEEKNWLAANAIKKNADPFAVVSLPIYTTKEGVAMPLEKSVLAEAVRNRASGLLRGEVYNKDQRDFINDSVLAAVEARQGEEGMTFESKRILFNNIKRAIDPASHLAGKYPVALTNKQLEELEAEDKRLKKERTSSTRGLIQTPLSGLDPAIAKLPPKARIAAEKAAIAADKIAAKSSQKARMIASTELSAAYSLGRLNTYITAGVEKVRWVNLDSSACKVCESRARKIFDVDELLSQETKTSTSLRVVKGKQIKVNKVTAISVQKQQGKWKDIDHADHVIPAHPHCRCHYEPVIPEEEKDREDENDPNNDPGRGDITPLASSWTKNAAVSALTAGAVGLATAALRRQLGDINVGKIAVGIYQTGAEAVRQRMLEKQLAAQEALRQRESRSRLLTLAAGGTLAIGALYLLLHQFKQGLDSKRKAGTSQAESPLNLMQQLSGQSVEASLLNNAIDWVNESKQQINAVKVAAKLPLPPREVLTQEFLAKFPNLMQGQLDLKNMNKSVLQRLYGLSPQDVEELNRQTAAYQRRMTSPLSIQVAPGRIFPPQLLREYPNLRAIEDVRYASLVELTKATGSEKIALGLQSYIKSAIDNTMSLSVRDFTLRGVPAIEMSREDILGYLPSGVAKSKADEIYQAIQANQPRDKYELAALINDIPGWKKDFKAKTVAAFNRADTPRGNINEILAGYQGSLTSAAKQVTKATGIPNSLAVSVAREYKKAGGFDNLTSLFSRLEAAGVKVTAKNRDALINALADSIEPLSLLQNAGVEVRIPMPLLTAGEKVLEEVTGMNLKQIEKVAQTVIRNPERALARIMPRDTTAIQSVEAILRQAEWLPSAKSYGITRTNSTPSQIGLAKDYIDRMSKVFKEAKAARSEIDLAIGASEFDRWQGYKKIKPGVRSNQQRLGEIDRYLSERIAPTNQRARDLIEIADSKVAFALDSRVQELEAKYAALTNYSPERDTFPEEIFLPSGKRKGAISKQIKSVSAEIASLKDAINKNSTLSVRQAGELNKRLNDLEGLRAKALEAQEGVFTSPAFQLTQGKLRDSANEILQDLSMLEQSNPAGLGNTQKQVDALKKELQTLSTSAMGLADSPFLSAINTKVAEIRNSIALSVRANSPDIQGSLQSALVRLEEMEVRINALPKTLQEADKNIKRSMKTLAAQKGSLQPAWNKLSKQSDELRSWHSGEIDRLTTSSEIKAVKDLFTLDPNGATPFELIADKTAQSLSLQLEQQYTKLRSNLFLINAIGDGETGATYVRENLKQVLEAVKEATGVNVSSLIPKSAQGNYSLYRRQILNTSVKALEQAKLTSSGVVRPAGILPTIESALETNPDQQALRYLYANVDSLLEQEELLQLQGIDKLTKLKESINNQVESIKGVDAPNGAREGFILKREVDNRLRSYLQLSESKIDYLNKVKALVQDELDRPVQLQGEVKGFGDIREEVEAVRDQLQTINMAGKDRNAISNLYNRGALTADNEKTILAMGRTLGNGKSLNAAQQRLAQELQLTKSELESLTQGSLNGGLPLFAQRQQASRLLTDLETLKDSLWERAQAEVERVYLDTGLIYRISTLPDGTRLSGARVSLEREAARTIDLEPSQEQVATIESRLKKLLGIDNLPLDNAAPPSDVKAAGWLAVKDRIVLTRYQVQSLDSQMNALNFSRSNSLVEFARQVRESGIH